MYGIIRCRGRVFYDGVHGCVGYFIGHGKIEKFRISMRAGKVSGLLAGSFYFFQSLNFS